MLYSVKLSQLIIISFIHLISIVTYLIKVFINKLTEIVDTEEISFSKNKHQIQLVSLSPLQTNFQCYFFLLK